MSTKVSIKYIEDEPSGAKAHLYEECLAPEDAPVYLDLTGLTEASVAIDPSGMSLTFAIPRTLARQLGLLSPEQTRMTVSAGGADGAPLDRSPK